MQKADLILSSRWLIPMDGKHRFLEHHSVAITDGKISAVMPTERMKQEVSADKSIDFKDHVLMPGLVNAHTHMAMSTMRGIGDDLPLMKWLQEHMWPVEAACVSAQFVRDGVELALAEMIRGGITCVNDMYFYATDVAQVMDKVGVRGRVGTTIFNVETPWSANVEECYAHTEHFLPRVKEMELVEGTVAAHAPYTNTEESLQKVVELAEKYDVPIHYHLQETEDEINQHMSLYDERPVASAARLGLLSERMIAVHMTQVSQEDIDMFKKHGGSIVHCPESNMKLASGACPVSTLLEHGLNVALGTDGACSNNDQDMFGEMRSAAFMAKLVDENPESLNALQVMEMATINGAKALGFGDITGSIEVGKSADVIAVDFSELNTQPVYDPVSHIVYAASSHQVSDVWVAGKHLLENKQLTTIDRAELQEKIDFWHDKIKNI